MSLAGFKKQLNKANQLFNEKIAGARGTELDPDFMEMERKIDVACRMVDDLVARTQEYLQPNPMARARMTAVKGLNNLQNKNKSMAYPQPEGILGESMVRHGKDFGSGSVLASALVESGEAYKQMAEIKYSLEDNVKQNFLDPFTSLQQRDLKEINHHRKKLEGRRLDFDCKKRKSGVGVKNTDDEIHQAEEKFVESKNLTESAMINFINSDAEHVAALYELVAAEVVYHQEAVRILSDLQQQLEERRAEAANKPKVEYVPTRASDQVGSAMTHDDNHHYHSASTPTKSPSKNNYNSNSNINNSNNNTGSNSKQPSCRALYTFTAENATELAFEENDIIHLVSQVDENWFEGEVHGRRGYFPVNYVEIIVPLH